MFSEIAIIKLENLINESEDQDLLDFLDKVKQISGFAEGEFDPRFSPFKKPKLLKKGVVSLVGSQVDEYKKGDDIDIISSVSPEMLKDDMILPVYDIQYDEKGPKSKYKTLYDLYLIPSSQEELAPETEVTFGEFFKIGWLRESGNYKYPLVAQRMLSGLHLQVHASPESTKIFRCRNKKDVTADFEQIVGNLHVDRPVVLNAIFADDKLYIFDVMAFGSDSAIYDIELHKRLLLLEKIPQNDVIKVLPYIVFQNQQELDMLGDGKYIVRWVNETINIQRPFWFVHSATKEADTKPELSDKQEINLDDIEIQDIPAKYELKNGILTIDGAIVSNSIKTSNDIPDSSGLLFFGVKKQGAREAFLKTEDDFFRVFIFNDDNKHYISKCSNQMPEIVLLAGDYSEDILEYNSIYIEGLNASGYEHLPYNWEEYVDMYEGG